MADETLWSWWEVFGANRGAMLELLGRFSPPRTTAKLSMVSFGAGGPWPHVTHLWQLPSSALDEALVSSMEDGLDENAFTWGKGRLLSRVRGELVGDRKSYLIEDLRCRTPDLLSQIDGPDVVFADLFARNEGIALWGADSFAECIERERSGWGTHGEEIEERFAWWGIVAPDDPSRITNKWPTDPDPTPMIGMAPR